MPEISGKDVGLYKMVLFLLSLFPAIAVEIDVSRFTTHYPNISPEGLGYLITADLLAKWLPGFLKFLLVPLILILLLSRFGSDFERGNVTLLLSKPLTRRRYFLSWVLEGLKLALISTLGIALSGALAMLAHGFEVRDYLIGSLALSLSLVGVIGVALLLLPFATSRDSGVFLGLGAFVVLLLLGKSDYSFIPTVYLERALSIGESLSVSYRAVGELLALCVALSLVGMEAFRRRELRGPESFSVPGFSFSPRGLYGVFLGLSLQSRRFIAFLALAVLTAFLNMGMLGDYHSNFGVPGVLNALISALNGVFLPFVVLPLGAVSISSAVEKGTVRVLLSKPLKRRNFFLGTLLSDLFAVFIGTTFYVALIVAYALHLGSPSGRTLELGLAFGSLLFLSLVQYLALSYLLSVFMRGRKALFLSLVLAFLLAFAVPISVTVASTSAEDSFLDALSKNSLPVPSPNLHYTVLERAVSPKRGLPPKSLAEILNYPGNLAMLVIPTVVYLAIAWLTFRKADLR
ncbi:ABC transporter permease [Thermococcus celericrescens]|uniref:ABC transporter permease n=1 Tax=Thermococcus celericrescens TaxID=227598 RepID=A0A100XX62_9EURY|nr:ABC transporter permease subunit [Thermococcus celericrescens]KUH33044.1 ABC transporter permease [Thermococcus celericrescens]